MGDATGKAIWEVARDQGYSVVTLDADFHEYSLLWGGPPLIIWLKCGDQPKSTILDKLLVNQEVIKQAFNDVDIGCIEIY